MAVHAASDRAGAATEFRATLGALGIAQHRLATLFGVGPRSVRRWQYGERRVPRGVAIVIRLLAAGAVTIAEVEQAAVPVQTNGNAKPELPAPLLGEPAPEQSALAPVKAATLTNPDMTTAEKVRALASGVCCWPCGDPGRPDFHFCGSPVVTRPYCERHRAMAYAAPPTSSRQVSRNDANDALAQPALNAR